MSEGRKTINNDFFSLKQNSIFDGYPKKWYNMFRYLLLINILKFKKIFKEMFGKKLRAIS